MISKVPELWRSNVAPSSDHPHSLIPRLPSFSHSVTPSLQNMNIASEENLVSFLIWAWHNCNWEAPKRNILHMFNQLYTCSVLSVWNVCPPLISHIASSLHVLSHRVCSHAIKVFSTLFYPWCHSHEKRYCLHLHDFHAHIPEPGCLGMNIKYTLKYQYRRTLTWRIWRSDSLHANTTTWKPGIEANKHHCEHLLMVGS